VFDFTRQLLAFRQAHPVFRRQRFLTGAEATELGWFTPAGTVMTGADSSNPSALAICLYLDGSDDPDRAADGSPLIDDDFLFMVNAWWAPLDFTIPATRDGLTWQTAIDTYDPAKPAASVRAGDQVPSAPARSPCSAAHSPQPAALRNEPEKAPRLGALRTRFQRRIVAGAGRGWPIIQGTPRRVVKTYGLSELDHGFCRVPRAQFHRRPAAHVGTFRWS
jgi:hypothetical protein